MPLATRLREAARVLFARSLAQTDKPKTLALTQGYEGAGFGRRLAGFNPGGDSINNLLMGSGDTLRSRSRKLVRENAWASSAMDEWCANAIGTGIVPEWKHPDPGIRRQLAEAWDDWLAEADADGATDFYGLQSLCWRSMMEGGDCLIRLRLRRPEDGLSVPLQLQVLEAEHLPLNKTDGGNGNNKVRAGIEFDLVGRRVAYHLYREHPFAGAFAFDSMQISRVPADQVIHLFNRTRPGQIRGEVWLARTIVKLWSLDKFEQSTLDRQALGAMMLAWITENNPDSDPLFQTTSTVATDDESGSAETSTTPAAPAGVGFAEIEPNTVMRLQAGEQMDFFKTPDVGANFDPFTKSNLRWVAKGAGLPYHQLSGDLSEVNYSSIRAGTIAFQRLCEQLQFSVMVHQMCRPTAKAWMDQAVISGRLDLPGYVKNPRPYLRIDWRTPRWEWVDPLKQVMAEKEKVRCNFKARSSVIRELGEDPETVDAQIAADAARGDALGLVGDADGRHADGKGGQANAAAIASEPSTVQPGNQ